MKHFYDYPDSEDTEIFSEQLNGCVTRFGLIVIFLSFIIGLILLFINIKNI